MASGPDRPLMPAPLPGAPGRSRSARHSRADERNAACPPRPSTTWCSAAPIRPARTTATSRAWRCCSLACPQRCPGFTVNRLCGSGLEAVGEAARAIKAGEAELMIAGGVESMSRAPFVMGKATEASPAAERAVRHHDRLALRQPADEEAVRHRLNARDGENVAADFQISARHRMRSLYASQMRAAKAHHIGRLAKEIAPVTIPQRKGDPRRVAATSTRARRRSSSSPAPARSSRRRRYGDCRQFLRVNDGAAALLIASDAAADHTA